MEWNRENFLGQFCFSWASEKKIITTNWGLELNEKKNYLYYSYSYIINTNTDTDTNTNTNTNTNGNSMLLVRLVWG